MKSSLLAVGLMALLPGAPAMWASQDFDSMQIPPYDPPKPAPDLSLPDFQGKTIRPADLKGKVVLIWFWATW
jgi:cytochrome oxidase Cu insertion factor (SCO1/SenC/PrrC family)